MDFKALRKRYGYSQEYVAKILGITRITYNSREKGTTPYSRDEYDKLVNLYPNEYEEKANNLIKEYNDISISELENLLESLQDMNY